MSIKIESVATKPTTREDAERPVIQWLNSLSQETASDLLFWVESVRGPAVVDTSRATADVSGMVKLNNSIPGGQGADWSEWVNCRVLPK